MKKLSLIFVPVAIIATVLGLNSCSEDLPYAGDNVVSPVIIGLLDKADSIHYVKVTRSFAGNNNAVEIAQIADSSYYSDVEVKIEEYTPVNSGGTLVLRRTWTLRDTILTNKETGSILFSEPKSLLFQNRRLQFNNTACRRRYRSYSFIETKCNV